MLHANFIISNIDRRVFDVRFFYSWASWNCFGENIFKIHSVSFKEEDAQYSRAKISIDFHYPNRQFYNTDRLYLRTVVMIHGVPTDHAFASFKLKALVEKGKGGVVKPFKDYHGKKGMIYKYGKVLCFLKKSEQSAPMDFSEIQYMERKRFRVFLNTLVDKERLYFQQFRPLNDIIDKVIFDVYPKIGLDFPAQSFAPIKQIPIEAQVLKKLIMKALEVYSMPEEQFIECCKSIGTVGRYTCEQILSLNALVLASQFHGLGMNYQADVNIDPQTGRIFGIDRMGEGDDDFGFGDCENMNSTPREFFVAIEELPSDIADTLLAAVKDMLSYYFALVISGSASQDSLSHVNARAKVSINGHITALFLSKYECFKEASDELPTFDDITERQEQLAKKPARPHLLSVWVECTSPQCPVFNPKTEIMGEEAGQSCLSDMNELINLMVSNAVFSKLIAPVEQMQRGLTEASPNHFLNYIASGIISHFYDPFKISLRQIALRPFLRQINEETGNEQFVYGCDMNDIISNRVFWSVLPPYDDEEMEALDHYIHHIPRIRRFHFTEDKRIASLNFLHQRGKADCTTFYCMPLMMRLADVDNATLRAMDETLLKDSNVEYFKWTIVEMGNESLIFLNVRPVGLKRRMIALQSIMETSIYANQPSKSCRVLGMRTFHRSNVGDRTFLEFSVNKMTYALSFQFMDESEQERAERFLKTHLKNNGEKFTANVYFGTDGLHIEPINSQAEELIISSINDLALEKYQRPAQKSVRFNANLQHYLLHVNVKDIDSDRVHSIHNNNNYQFVANNHFVYHAQLEDAPSDASLSFKENVADLKGLTYSKMVSMELHKENDRTSYVNGIIEQEEVRMFYFSNFDHFLAFMPESFTILIFKTVASEKQFRFTIMVNSKVVILIMTFAQELAANDQNILASATVLSITEDHLHFKGSLGEISLRDGVTFQLNENSTSLMDILSSTQQALGKETEGIPVNWTASPYRESPNKTSVVILASDIPLIVETYFTRRNVHEWIFVGSNEGSLFFVSHRLLDKEEEVIEYGYLSFKRSAVGSMMKWQEKQQVSIAMHDNMIYMATEDESSRAIHFSIPTNVIFVQSTVELSMASLSDIMKPYLRPRESIGGSSDGSSLLLHCIPLHFHKITFNESYFIIYDPYAQLFVIILYNKQNDEWNIHFVNLAYYEEFIILDSANELQVAAVTFKNILKDSATLISIMELLKVLRQRMGMNDIYFSKLLYYILYYISLKKDVIQNVGSADSNLSIYFYCVSLLLSRSVFLNERDLKSWWEDESADLSLKLNYILQLLLSSPLKSFTIYPQEQSTYLSLEMRNVAF